MCGHVKNQAPGLPVASMVYDVGGYTFRSFRRPVWLQFADFRHEVSACKAAKTAIVRASIYGTANSSCPVTASAFHEVFLNYLFHKFSIISKTSINNTHLRLDVIIRDGREVFSGEGAHPSKVSAKRLATQTAGY